MTVTIAVSFAALIFVRPIDGWMSYGSELMVFTAIVAGLGMFFFSSFSGTIAIPEDRIAPILALMAALIIQTMGNAPSQAVAMTVLAAIALSTLLAGLVCYLLGQFRLGNIVRFFPHPVIGGFLAGSGWLLVVGSCRVMYETHSSLEHMADFFAWDVVRAWIPAAIFGVLLYVVSRWARHYLTLPALIVLALILFFCRAALCGYFLNAGTRERLAAGGRGEQIVSSAPDGVVYRPGGLGRDRGPAGGFGAIILTAVISILLNTTALELAVDRDIDLNQELRAAGLTNLAGGLGGCMSSCQSLSLSKLASEMGAPSRLVGLFLGGHLRGVALVWIGFARLHSPFCPGRDSAVSRNRVFGRVGLGRFF